MGKKRRRRRRRRSIGKQIFMVSKYEKVTSALLALNLFIGFMDGIMLVMWISGLKAQAIEAVPVNTGALLPKRAVITLTDPEILSIS